MIAGALSAMMESQYDRKGSQWRVNQREEGRDVNLGGVEDVFEYPDSSSPDSDVIWRDHLRLFRDAAEKRSEVGGE